MDIYRQSAQQDMSYLTKGHSGYMLIFSAHFDRDKGIDCGRLLLEHIDRGHQEIWIALSSHLRGQQREGFHAKGGMLPPAYRVPRLHQWSVNTNPIDLSHIKGVSGNFYKISPYEVVTDKNGNRGDFGIHLDGNVPGSAGCIVMGATRFRHFENTMTRLREERVRKLPLIVAYS